MKTDQTTEITSAEASRLRKEIKQLVKRHKHGSMTLCRIVYQASFSMVSVAGDPTFVWQLWGYKSWEDFIGLELSLHTTTAYAYRRIWKRFYVELQGCWDEANLLPITKMRLLCSDRGMNQRNVNTKLKAAATKTCSKLMSEIYGVEELCHFSASMDASEMKTVKKAISKYRSAFGEEAEAMPRGQIVANMLREWSQIHDNVERSKRGKLQLVG